MSTFKCSNPNCKWIGERHGNTKKCPICLSNVIRKLPTPADAVFTSAEVLAFLVATEKIKVQSWNNKRPNRLSADELDLLIGPLRSAEKSIERFLERFRIYEDQ